MELRRTMLATCACALLHAAASPTLAQQNCMRAGSSRERVTGTLTKRGADFLFQVDGPICLRGSDPEDRKNGVKTIHLYSNSSRVQRELARSTGQYIEVVGRPFGALTQHHKAPVVMEVREVIRLGAEPNG